MIKTRGIGFLIIIALYYAAGAMGLVLHSVSGFATFIWAPTGISLAALLIGGRAYWPAVAIGAFLVNFEAGAPVWASVGIATGNTLEALVGASIMMEDPEFRLPLNRFKDTCRLLFMAIPLAAVISATIGVFCVWRMGESLPIAQIRNTWVTWWVGNITGGLLIAPLALSWVGWHSWRVTRTRVTESVALGSALFLVSAYVFLSQPSFLNPSHALLFTVFPFIIWAALRFSIRGVVTSAFIISCMVIVGAILKRGPFGALPLEQSLYYMDTFMAVAATTGLLLVSALSEREKTRETMQIKKELQEYIDNMSIFSAKVAINGKVLLLNRSAQKAFGMTAEQVSKTGFLEGPWWNSGSAEKEKAQNAFRKAVQGEATTQELEIWTATRGIIPTNFTLTPVYQWRGKVDYLVVEAKDLSEQKATERMLRKHEMMLAEAQSVAHLGSWEWDVESNHLLFSEELYRVHGTRPDQFTPTFESYLTLVHPDDRDRFRNVIGECVKTGRPFHAQKRIIKPDGSIRDLDTKGIAIKDKTGKILRLVGSCQDISEYKKAERERAELLVREQKARQEAEAATRAKDLFLATLSHELRTPLTTILSWIQILQRKQLDPEKIHRGYVMIEQSAKAQHQMINDLLDISRIIMNKLSLNMQPIDPCSVVLQAIESVRPQAEERLIRIKTEFKNCSGTVNADATHLRQIIWNLLNNALRFTGKGGEVEIRAEPVQSDNRNWIRIKIKDNGKGISPELIPKVFDLFMQADSSSTRKHGGLGIGLSIVKRLTEMHHGKVSVHSEGEGKGTDFSVDLPLLTNIELPDRSNKNINTESGEHPASRNQSPLAGLRILLIDDDRNTNEAIGESLRVFNSEVFSAFSAQQGLEMLDQINPDVVVCDIAMPEEDGYSFIQKVRRRPFSRHSKVPAIALSAYASAEDQRKSLAAGFYSHVSKPVDMELLAQVILQATLSKSRRIA